MIRAQYDSNGDIILASVGDSPVPEVEEIEVRVQERVACETRRCARASWTVVHETEAIAKPTPPAHVAVKAIPKSPARPSTLQTISTHSKAVLRHGSHEGKAQLDATIAETKAGLFEARKSLSTLPSRIRAELGKFWRSANAPVTFLTPRKPGRRPPTKLKLFVVDTIRFGGTFAGIFVVLFVGINYQSFLQIAWADLALGNDLQTQQGLERIVSGTKDTGVGPLQVAEAVDFSEVGDVLAYLPPVGPYEDRLIIPKLGKNVPIVRPSMDALMKEDWKKFEEDIQTALKGGVVFYPGSAKPGQAGNFFLTGHSSYYPWDDGDYKDVFARLGDLTIGDTYSVYYGGDRHTYRVTSKREVKPSDVSVLDQPTDKRIATLMTCTPIGTTLRRLIIVAEEIDPSTGLALEVGERAEDNTGNPFSRLESLPI